MNRLLKLSVVLLVCGCGVRSVEEPRYRGLPLSKWAVDLKDRDIWTVSRAAKALGAAGEPAIPYLSAAFEENDSARAEVRSAMTRMGEPAAPAFSKALTSKKPAVRYEAAYALAWISRYAKNPESVLPKEVRQRVEQELLSGLESDDVGRRQGSAQALEQFRIAVERINGTYSGP
jgi:HEAT repeat protein